MTRSVRHGSSAFGRLREAAVAARLDFHGAGHMLVPHPTTGELRRVAVTPERRST